jgi:hypothetical protein
MGKAEMDKISEEHSGPMTKDEFTDWYNKCMKTKHNFIMINYKKPDDERYTERFTKIHTPLSLTMDREDAAYETSDRDESSASE